MEQRREKDKGIVQPTFKKRESHEALTHDDYTVGWVCALSKELAAATAMLDERHPVLSKPSSDGNAYTLGSIGDHNIVIAGLPKGMLGNVSAATVVSYLVTTFPFIKLGLMVGIGGGVPSNKVRLGDVVVSTPTGQFPGVVKWDSGKVHDDKFERTGSLNNPPYSLLTALSQLETQHNMVGTKIPDYLQELEGKWPKLALKSSRTSSLKDVLFKASYNHVQKPVLDIEEDADDEEDDEEQESCLLCDKAMTVKRTPREMVVHYGLIASGDKLIKDATARNRLNKDLGGCVLCIEMEAAGLMNQFPCVVIRGICDYADSHKNKDWQEHAAAVAVAFAKELLQYVEPSDVKRQRPAKDTLENVHSIVSETREHVAHLKSEQRKSDDIRMLDWLTPVDYGLQQSRNYNIKQPGTGDWFFDSTELHTWLATRGQTLFCQGIPGAGKTILTSTVIEHLNSNFHSDSGIGISYIYCNFQRHDEQVLDQLLLSLIKQLAGNMFPLPEDVRDLYHEHEKGRTRPTSQKVFDTLKNVVSMYSRVFILVDALDEYGLAGSRGHFLDRLSRLQQASQVSVFITSRFDTSITTEMGHNFKSMVKMEVRAAVEDVERYVEGNMNLMPSAVQENMDLRKNIKEIISASVDGMFLLAQIYLNLLSCKTSEAEIRNQLMTFADGHGQGEEDTAALNNAYEQTMVRINQQETNQSKLAKQVLLWLTYARRELTVKELQHALAFSSVQHPVCDTDLPFYETMVAVCAGLVIVDETRSIITLAHYTVQGYIKQSPGELFPMTERDITRICFMYISSTPFHLVYHMNWDGLEEKLQPYPFYLYAAINWGHHARESAMPGDELMKLFHGEAKVVKSVGPLTISGSPSRPLDMADSVTELHVAAFFGLAEVVGRQLEKGFKADPTGTNSRTPLSYAAEHGYETVVRLLLEGGAETESHITEPSRHGGRYKNSGRTPLSYAAAWGRAAVTQVLLENEADPESQCVGHVHTGWTALSFATRYGHEPVVQLLLEKGVGEIQINFLRAAHHGHEEVVQLFLRKGAELDYQLARNVSSYFHGRTAISLAAEEGHEAIVRLLLKKGPTSHLKMVGDSHNGRTLLSFAAGSGNITIVKLLLNVSKDQLNSVDRNGRTPLSWAAARGYEAIVSLLLEQGANHDPNPEPARNGERLKEDGTPLSWAAENGHLSVVQLLLDKGANPDAKTLGGSWDHGRTPLSLAAAKRHEAVVRLLLANGACHDSDVMSGQHNGRTPLSFASHMGHEDIVRLLLMAGANPNSETRGTWSDGRTPLSFAAGRGHDAIIRLLIQKGANLEPMDSSAGVLYTPPLVVAASSGHEATTRLLIEAGVVQIDVPDETGRTPLSHMAERGHEAAVRLLLEKGANIESKAIKYDPYDDEEFEGRTPLSIAAEHGHGAIVQLLIAKGADVNSKPPGESRYAGRTPLSFAADDGHETVVRMLLERDNIDLNSACDDGWTPLLYAAICGHKAIMRLLLEMDKTKPNAADHLGRTALSYAAEKGYAAIVRLLLEKGVDVDSRCTALSSHEGRTPLSFAAQSGYEEVVRLLIERGADIRSMDIYGQTPLWFAIEKGNAKVVELLNEADIDVDCNFARITKRWRSIMALGREYTKSYYRVFGT